MKSIQKLFILKTILSLSLKVIKAGGYNFPTRLMPPKRLFKWLLVDTEFDISDSWYEVVY